MKGIRLAFLAYVDTPAEGAGYSAATWEATPTRAGVAWARPLTIAAGVAAARAQADVVVVLLHSGFEGRSAPNPAQKAAAHAAIDAGAALVIGAHSHELQGVEHYRGGVIAYSLGNFVFDGFSGTANETAILAVTLTRAGVRDVRWTPAIIRSGRPQIAGGQLAAGILARLDRLSAQLSR